jgi:hypothetical protein
VYLVQQEARDADPRLGQPVWLPARRRRRTSPRCRVAQPVARDEVLPPAAVITNWLSSRNADDFPYDAVLAEFHRVGKHFVATEMLEALVGVRAVLTGVGDSVPGARLLDRFLDSRPGQVGWTLRQPDVPWTEFAATADGRRTRVRTLPPRSGSMTGSSFN